MILLALLVGWPPAQALCEEAAIVDALELDALEEYARTHSFDFSLWMNSLVSGDVSLPAGLSEMLTEIVRNEADGLKQTASAVLVPVGALFVLRLMLPQSGSTQHMAAYVCRISCIPPLFAVFQGVREQTELLMQNILKCSELLSPALIASVILSGAETTAALLGPMSGICAELIESVLARWGIALSAAAAVLTVAGSLSRTIRLKRLHDLLRRILHWGVGGMLAAFMAVLSIQGRLGAGRDTAASRTARYAIENIVPVVGGKVSDSLDALLVSANVVKNALGVSGITLLLTICIAPLTRMILYTLALRTAAAIAEPMSDEGIAALAGQLADCIEMLLIVAVSAVVLLGLLAGSCISAAANIIR